MRTMIFSKLDAALYPFISLASQIVEELESSLGVNVILASDSEVLRRSVERIREAVYARVTSTYEKDLDVEILSHPVALLLVKSANNTRLLNVYAEAEKNRVLMKLLHESYEKLIELAIDGFSWRVRKEENRLLLRFDDYLRASINIVDSYWKLVNREVANGYVELSKRDFSRLMAEAYRMRILDKTQREEDIKVPEHIKLLAEELNKEFQEVLPKGDVKVAFIGEYNPSAFPPCILRMLDDANQGKNIPHMARFTLATFLLSIGKRPEELLEIFRKMPDFDEDRTLYHLRHIAGEIGSRKKYLPPSCATLRTFNLCSSDGGICFRVKHPLVYYNIKLKKLKSEGHEGEAR
ncbi:MAG: DNA primase large subunit PriL [Candidatus Nezhaarchaeales archaeon]